MSGLASLRFMIVDDMSTMRKIIGQQLKSNGATMIMEADDGSSAWEQMEKTAESLPIQYVISDWNMPKMNGLDLLRKCRAHPVYKNVAFLLVTAESEVSQVKEAIVSGVDNYIVKPFTPSNFGEKLMAVYNKRFPGK